MHPSSQDLAVLDQACRMLAEAESFDEIKTIRDKAESARNYVKAAKLGLELQNRAAEIKLRAERKAGGLLRSMNLRGGDRRSKLPQGTLKLKLENLGVSRKQSMLWQRVASVSEREFCDYIRSANNLGREITSASLLRVAARKRPSKQHNGASLEVQVSLARIAEPTPNDLFGELKCHCRLLADILQPVYHELGVDLKTGEKRLIARLIREIDDLITQAQKTCVPAAHQRGSLRSYVS